MRRQPGFFEIEGARLEHAWWGPGPDTAPTLVLLHEALGAVSTWRTFPERLAQKTGLGVLAYAREGHGRSSPGPRPRPLTYLRDEARTLPRVLDAAGVRACLLVGHSDGASIAALHAAQAPHPALRGLVLLAPHFFVEEVTLEGIRAAVRAFERGDLREKLERHHGPNVDGAFRGWSETWLDPRFRAWDVRGALEGLVLPCTAAQGTADPYGSLAQIECVAELAPGPVDLVTLDGVGHVPHLEAPEAVERLVRHRALTVWPELDS
jgi:pimeloyl-ACP methyl ester carboxylesterase